MDVEKVKKGPVCYVYYAIKKRRQLKLEQERETPKKEESISEAKIILNQNLTY